MIADCAWIENSFVVLEGSIVRKTRHGLNNKPKTELQQEPWKPHLGVREMPSSRILMLTLITPAQVDRVITYKIFQSKYNSVKSQLVIIHCNNKRAILIPSTSFLLGCVYTRCLVVHSLSRT